MKMRYVTLLAAAALALGACKGDDGAPGPAGPPGPQGPAGTGGGGGGGGGTPGVGAPGTGLNFQIQSATVAPGAAPTVTFKATDAAGQPVALKEEIQAGTAVAPRFTLAALQDSGSYTSYYVNQAGNQAVTEPAGAAADMLARLVPGTDAGVYTYTFGAPVATPDTARTNTLAMWGTRTVSGVQYVGHTSLDFVPAGGTAVDRQVVTEAACNSCHKDVQAHGTRRGLKLCLTCHSPQTSDPDTGNTVDFKVMIHKIHMGAELPSSKDTDPANNYKIIGFQNATIDFSHIELPPSHSTYIENGSDPGLIRDCALCHQGNDAARSLVPSRAACFSCHDNINPETGAGHPFGLVNLTDAACAGCHGPDAAAPVARYHDVNFDTVTKTAFAEHKYQLTIDNVTSVAAGSRPVVDFTVTLDGQPYDISTKPLGSLAFQAVPLVNARDYGKSGFTGAAAAAPTALVAATGLADPAVVTAVDAAAGKFRYTFPTALLALPAPLPPDAAVTWAFGVESYFKEVGPNNTTLTPPAPVAKPAATLTPLFFKKVGDTAGTARQKIASNDKCNACHVELGFHGDRARLGVDYCATCHNPNLDNRGRVRFPVGTTGYQVESVDIGMMSHRIHTGSDLPSVQAANAAGAHPKPGEPGSIVFGAQRTGDTPSNSDFSQFAMPPSNSTYRCLTCHEAGTWGLPAEGRLPIKRSVMACATTTGTGDCVGTSATTGRTVTAELKIPRATAMCTGCHDGAATIAHAKLNTVDTSPPLWDGVGETETCTTCHGPGKDWDALKVHPGETP